MFSSPSFEVKPAQCDPVISRATLTHEAPLQMIAAFEKNPEADSCVVRIQINQTLKTPGKLTTGRKTQEVGPDKTQGGTHFKIKCGKLKQHKSKTRTHPI